MAEESRSEAERAGAVIGELHAANRLALESAAVAQEGMDGVGEALAGTLALLDAVEQLRSTGMLLNATLGAAVVSTLKGRGEGAQALQLARAETEAAVQRFERMVAAATRLDLARQARQD